MVRIRHLSFDNLMSPPLRIALGLKGELSTLPTEFRWGWEWRGLIENIQFILSQQTEGLPNGEPSFYWWTWLGIIGISSVGLIRKHSRL